MSHRKIVVVGHGAAGLCAALSAVETARERGIDVHVTLIDRAPEDACGGNSRWSPSNIRMCSPDAMEPGFVDEIVAQSGGRADRAYFERLAAEAPATAQWLQGKGIEFHSPPYYLAKGPARIQPVGGVGALYPALSRAARGTGIEFLYGRELRRLVVDAAQAMLKAAELGWGADSSSFRQVFISQMLHDATAEQQRAVDEAQRLTISGANAVRFMKEVFEIDTRDAAPKVQCPTLVFHAKEDPCFPFEEGRLLASLISNARFVPLASKNHLPFETEAAWPVFLSELRAFLPASRAGSGSRSANAGASSKPPLTPRQIEILREVGLGQTDKQIARKLSLSPRTVEMHVANVLLALKCRTRAEAVRRAMELKLTR